MKIRTRKLTIFLNLKPVKPTPVRAKSELANSSIGGSINNASSTSSSNSSSQPQSTTNINSSSKTPSLISSTPSKTSSLASLSAAVAGISSSSSASTTETASVDSLVPVTTRSFPHPIAFAAVAKSGARKLKCLIFLYVHSAYKSIIFAALENGPLQSISSVVSNSANILSSQTSIGNCEKANIFGCHVETLFYLLATQGIVPTSQQENHTTNNGASPSNSNVSNRLVNKCFGFLQVGIFLH